MEPQGEAQAGIVFPRDLWWVVFSQPLAPFPPPLVSHPETFLRWRWRKPASMCPRSHPGDGLPVAQTTPPPRQPGIFSGESRPSPSDGD